MKAIEIGIILIIILVIFGVILSSIENSTQKAIKEVEANNMEKLISEVVDNLINNPGVPDNWQEYGKGTPGLAIVLHIENPHFNGTDTEGKHHFKCKNRGEC